MKIKFLTILIATYLLTACGSTSQEELKTVDYYQQNKEELSQKIKECSNNPGELMKTANCTNAFQARKNASAGGLSSGSWGSDVKW